MYFFIFISVRPNIFVGRVEGSAIYQKWYFEVTVDHLEQTTHMMPHLRIGWANAKGLALKNGFTKVMIVCVVFRYIPYPGGGEKWGGNGVGDDLYSYGFDGAFLWSGGRSTPVLNNPREPYIRKSKYQIQNVHAMYFKFYISVLYQSN